MHTQRCTLDILLQVSSPIYSCQRCCALRRAAPCDASTAPAQCPICGMPCHLPAPGGAIQFDNLFEHGRALAILASRARGFRTAPHAAPPHYAYPPARALFDAFHYAQRFVHFTTGTICPQLLGALTMTAQRVHVRGLVAEAADSLSADLTRPEEAPYLDIRPLPQEGDTPRPETLIVVDGLVAFRGLTSLTLHGLRQAATQCAAFDIVTDIDVVMQCHNVVFSPLWATFGQRQPPTMEAVPAA